jgi:hypothetical protein
MKVEHSGETGTVPCAKIGVSLVLGFETGIPGDDFPGQGIGFRFKLITGRSITHL